MRWQDKGLCRGKPRKTFYPEDDGHEVNSADWSAECAAVAKRYCLPCPVRLSCYASAQEDEGESSRGIWGGVTFVDRRRLSKVAPVRCGCGTILDPLIFLRTGEIPLFCPAHAPEVFDVPND